MELLLDIGNSRLKGALLSQGELRYLSPAGHRDNSISEIMQLLSLPGMVERVVVSSVASDELNYAVAEWVYERYQLGVEFLRSQSAQLGLINGYLDPHKLGVDRWLAMLAGWNRYRQLLCVVDCGSAVTIDLINNAGHHLGGMIMPGLSMQRRMAEVELAKLGSQYHETVGNLWGRDTVSCLSSGSILSVVGAITLAVQKIRRSYGDSPQLLITGGDASLISPWLEIPYIVHENLVIEGIALMTGSATGQC